MTKRILGPLYIALAASLWGLSAALAKFLFVNNVDTLIVVQTRSAFAFFLLLPVALFKRDLLVLDARAWLRILPLGIIGVAGANFTYYYTVSQTTVATAIILQYTAPILVALYQVVFEKKALSLFDIFLILLVLLGCYTTVTNPGAHQPLFTDSLKISGWLAGIGSAVCWAFFNIYERKLGEIPLPAKLFNALLYSTLFWFLIQSPVSLIRHIPNTRMLLLLVGFACLSVLLPYIFYFSGLRLSGALPAIVTASIEPVMAIFFSALVVGEMVSITQSLGALCVIVGATLFNIKSAQKQT